jgi:hypothetical protein
MPSEQGEKPDMFAVEQALLTLKEYTTMDSGIGLLVKTLPSKVPCPPLIPKGAVPLNISKLTV